MNREEWLEKRKSFVTSTEMAALFGLSEWETPFGLWQRKRNNLESEVKETERMYFGRQLEPIVAQEFAKKMKVGVELDNEFRTKDGIGASYDYSYPGEGGEPTPLEIKTVDSMVFRKKFVAEGNTILDFPLVYELQFQTQLLLHHSDTMSVAVLVGGNSFFKATRTSDEKVQDAIVKRVREFWASKGPPQIDFERDTATLNAMYAEVLQGKVPPSSELDAIVEEYLEAKRMEKAAEAKKVMLRNKMKSIVGKASGVVGDRYTIHRSRIKPAKMNFTRGAYTTFVVKGKE